jgi:hypothetical protein
LNPRDRILPYLDPSTKRPRRPRSLSQIRFGPATGLVIAVIALIASTSLAAKQQQDLGMHFLAIALMSIACAASAAGCVVGFGNHDNGYLPIRKQIFGGIVGLIDLVMAFATIILFAAMLKP